MSNSTLRTAASGLALALLVPLALTSCSSGAPQAKAGPSGPQLHVGVFEIAEEQVISDTVTGFESELRAKLPGTHITFDVKNAQGQASLIQSVARVLHEGNYDMYAVMGTPALISLAKIETKRPIIGLAVGDPVSAGVAKSLDAPGGNVTGSTDFVDPGLQLDAIAQVGPAAHRIGTLYDPSNDASLIWIKALKPALARHGMTLVESPLSGAGSVDRAASSLAGRTDAILIGPDATATGAEAAIASVAGRNHLPLYVTAGDATMTGITAVLGANYREVGQQAGEVAAKVAGGASPASVPFTRPAGTDKQFNKASVSRLDLTIPAALLTGATG
jgi:putative ABC transport system substrate-binding protein